MYIKEVELKNFKSFGKSIKVPLKNDFITVTGPNGSGKSNIVDALLLRFVSLAHGLCAQRDCQISSIEERTTRIRTMHR